MAQPKKSIIEEIADQIPDEEAFDGPVAEIDVGAAPDEGNDVDADLASFVPKGHIPEFGEVGVETEVMGDTPAADTPNAAPPSPEPINEPAGVIKMDVPLFLRVMEAAKDGADIHHVASKAASLCGDPSCNALTMDHFEQIAPVAPVAPMGMDMNMSPDGSTPDSIANGMIDSEFPGDEELPGIAGEDIDGGGPPIGEGGPEAIEGEEPGNDPVGEAANEPEPEVVGEAGGKEGGAEEPEEEDKVEENIKPLNDPIMEHKSNAQDEVDDSLAESIDRLVKLMSPKSQLIFKDTQNPSVIEFQAKRNANFPKIFAESITKALIKKSFLSEHKLGALAKFSGASVINPPTAGERHLLVLK